MITKEAYNSIGDEFSERFEKRPSVNTTPVYEIYISGARKLWDKYSKKYDLRPQRNAKSGDNRGVKFYEDTISKACFAYVCIGKTVTIYVQDENIRNRIPMDFHQFKNQYRCTVNTIEELLEAIEGIF